MRARLRQIHSADVDDLATWRPQGDFALPLQLLVGPADGQGEESFDVTVCTPGWLSSRVAVEGTVEGRHKVIVASWDWNQLSRFFRDRIESLEGATWSELAMKIGRLGKWEFEDYREFTGTHQ